MSLLTFVLPTRGKHRELAIALKSIAEQVGSADVKILVLYNRPEADTLRAIERAQARWPFIGTVGFDGEPDYAEKFRGAFMAAPDSDWVWMFGDDDVLEPKALEFMLPRLKAAPPELKFIHVAEKGRESGSNGTYTGRMIDMCKALGWIEFTGFNTGNIVRGADLALCGMTKNWDLYAKNSYVHSCALLEGLLLEQAQFIDLPMVRVQPDYDTEKTQANWAKGNAQVRYLYLTDAIAKLYEMGVLTRKLPAKFFRYHNYHLWDRHITTFIATWVNNRKIWQADWAENVLKMASFVKEDDIAEKIRKDVDRAVRCVMETYNLLEQQNKLDAELTDIFNSSASAVYPFSFIDGMEDRKAA